MYVTCRSYQLPLDPTFSFYIGHIHNEIEMSKARRCVYTHMWNAKWTAWLTRSKTYLNKCNTLVTNSCVFVYNTCACISLSLAYFLLVETILVPSTLTVIRWPFSYLSKGLTPCTGSFSISVINTRPLAPSIFRLSCKSCILVILKWAMKYTFTTLLDKGEWYFIT